jgi:hypothetical protein
VVPKLHRLIYERFIAISNHKHQPSVVVRCLNLLSATQVRFPPAPYFLHPGLYFGGHCSWAKWRWWPILVWCATWANVARTAQTTVWCAVWCVAAHGLAWHSRPEQAGEVALRPRWQWGGACMAVRWALDACVEVRWCPGEVAPAWQCGGPLPLAWWWRGAWVRWRLLGSEVALDACVAVRWALGAHVVVTWRLGEVAPAWQCGGS